MISYREQEEVKIERNGKIETVEVTVRKDREARYGRKARVYVSVSGESLAENLMNRRNRPVKVYREIAEKALAAAGVQYEKLQWSQYAGCTCACSPGFVMTGSWDTKQCDIWLAVDKTKDVENNGFITPLEVYGFRTPVSAEEVVEADTAVMC